MKTNCPMCNAELELTKVSLPLGSISRIDCNGCKRFTTSSDGLTELIRNQAGKWWIFIDAPEAIYVFGAGTSPDIYPYTPVNYQNPQETIDRLLRLKAFL